MLGRLPGVGCSIEVNGLGGVEFRVVGRILWREIVSGSGLRLRVSVHESSAVNNVAVGY